MPTTQPHAAPYSAHTWNDATFEAWRYKQDDAADEVAESIIKSPHHHQVYQALSHVHKNSDLVNIEIFDKIDGGNDTTEDHDRLVTLLNQYFRDTQLMSYLTEQNEAVQQSSKFFNNYAFEATMALAVRSLLKQYAAFRSTNVLVFTKLLTKYPHRRILETMQFVMDVMDPQGYGANGHAIRSIQKLRLIHALIRARLNNSLHDVAQFGLWNEKEWGNPINQQDMIFAVHTFSIEVLDGLIASGEKVTSTQIDSYYLTWHYIGKALGVKDEINPMTYAEGKQLQARIYQKEFTEHNPNGPVLAEPLLNFMQQILPTHPPREHIYAIIKLYNNQDEATRKIFEKNLKIPISQAHDHFLRRIKMGDWLWHKFNFIRYLFTPKSKKALFYHALAMKNFNLLTAIVSLEKTWSGRDFRISDGLGELASQQDQTAQKEGLSLPFKIAHKFVDDLNHKHPSFLVDLVHKLFFKSAHKNPMS